MPLYFYDGRKAQQITARDLTGRFPSDGVTIVDDLTMFGKTCRHVRYSDHVNPNRLKSKFYFFSGVRKDILHIRRIIFNDPATIVFWKDGEKTIVKRTDDDIFNPEKGICLALCKRLIFALGIEKNYYKILKQIALGDISDLDMIVRNVYFNGDLSIMIFQDGTKTFCKRSENDDYDPEMAVMILILKRYLGNSFMKKIFKK